jgi:hypothetical protein
MPRWLKISLKIMGALMLLIIAVLIGLSIYVSTHKEKILALVTTDLNKNIDGKLNVGGFDISFIKSFPNLSVTLENVSLQDKQWARHHQTLLVAKKFDVAVDVSALLRGTISVNHIDINDAAIDLYTDSTGYSNSSVFKNKSSKKDTANSGSSSAQVGRFSLSNVVFTVDDRRAKKLFKFEVRGLKSRMAYPDSGWTADMHLNVKAKSMAFSTTHGSFIKDKVVEGDLTAGYNQKSGDINVTSSNFTIGGDDFGIVARFATGKSAASFTFHITADKLLWRHAAELVSANITQKLNLFNLDKPIAVTAVIAGSFSGGGDPYLYITADVRNNRLTVPGNIVDKCNFRGVFTNDNVKGQKFGDENSVIHLLHFTGTDSNIPFTIDTCNITNLIKPIASGNIRASFPISDLNVLSTDLAKFSKGKADISLHFRADIVNYEINRPMIAGSINVKDADIHYLPADLIFKSTSISINFVSNDLILNNIRLQTGKSIVQMEARVNNFLNLYYDAPEKIALNLQITSPQLYIGEFLGLLKNGQQDKPIPTPAQSKKATAKNISRLNAFLTKAKVGMHIRAANVHYFKFWATDVTADLFLYHNGLQLKNVSAKSSGGSLKINAGLVRQAPESNFNLSAIISNVDIHEFFYAFDNFGIKGITYKNLEGLLSANTQITGKTNGQGSIVPGSINGMVNLNLKNGALLNYQPLISVGKFVFPFRKLHNIVIPTLDAKFDLQGNKIIINPMLISSSVLNADVAGVYSLANETDITLDVPLRNPKNDEEITDTVKLAKKRYKGVVVHVRAKDDGTGKIKISRNKDYKLL